VDEALVDRTGLVAIGQFPQLGNVLQRDNEAFARRRIVDGRDARAAAFRIPDGNHLEQRQIARVEHDERLRQVVADEDIAAVR